jgi:isopentenyl-diphosphate delta-isomerase
MEYLDIYDADRNLIQEHVLRSEIELSTTWLLAAHLWIVDSKKRLLMQRRSPQKTTRPNVWDISAAGHVSSGEDPLDAVIRECAEELGLNISSTDLELACETIDLPWRYFNTTYVLKRDIDIAALTLQEDEVSEMAWVHIAEIADRLEKNDPDILWRKEEFVALVKWASMPEIITKQGNKPGPNLAVFACIHGNELVGKLAFEALLPELVISTGTIHFVIGNQPALAIGQRYCERNLNRAFFSKNSGTTQEDVIARELMKLLDTCDALLDLHCCNEDGIEPFVICPDRSLELAKIMPVSIVSTGWSNLQSGSTDGYMDSIGKKALCMECGYVSAPQQFVPIAIVGIMRFLAHYGCIEKDIQKQEQVHLVAGRVVRVPAEGIRFTREYRTFDVLHSGECYAVVAGKELCSEEESRIIFPRPHNPVGSEACVIARVVA